MRNRAAPRATPQASNAFIAICCAKSLIAADPTLNLDSPKLPRSLPKSLTEADVERLLNSADTHARH